MIIDRYVEVHRSAADLTILNIVLRTDRTIDQQIDPFTTIGTFDLCFGLKVHGL